MQIVHIVILEWLFTNENWRHQVWGGLFRSSWLAGLHGIFRFDKSFFTIHTLQFELCNFKNLQLHNILKSKVIQQLGFFYKNLQSQLN